MSRAGSVAEDPGDVGNPWPGGTSGSGLMKRRKKTEDWRREVEALQFLYGVAEVKLALLVYLALERGASNPRDLLDHLSIKGNIAVDGGLSKTWVILDREYLRTSYRKTDLVQSRYDRVRRRPYQQMPEYLKELCAC
eukprot:5462375-Amphidinium_carterae.1